MMLKSHILQVFLGASLSIACVGTAVQAQSPVNKICKTGSDVDLPVIKSKIANLAAELKRIKQVKQSSRARVDALRAEIMSIDVALGPWRARHKSAAANASASENAYAVYKANWIDSGELKRLTHQNNLRKRKHADYKIARAQYLREKTEFKNIGDRYQYIARDLVDRDGDCAAAMVALQ